MSFPRYSHKPLREALADVLRERRADGLGRFEFAPFYRELPKEFKPNTTAAVVQGTRPVNPGLLQAMASALDLPGPKYFREYRLWQIEQGLREHPEVSAEIYDLVMETFRLLNEKGEKPAG